MDPRLALTRSLVRRNLRRRARNIAMPTLLPLEEAVWLICKTRASYRRGSTRRTWLARDRMAKARTAFLLFTRTTTTSAAPEGGKHFASFTYLVGRWVRYTVLVLLLCGNDARRFGFLATLHRHTKKCKGTVCPALMNGQPWARSLGLARFHGFQYLASCSCLSLLGWIMLLCQMPGSASLVIFVIAIACT